MEVARPASFIYINGYPGVGKLTIAKELLNLLPSPAKLLDNHLLIDPVAALLDRGSGEYQSLRKRLRLTVLSAIAESSELKSTTLIFTDQQSSSAVGSDVAQDYYNAAKTRGCPFYSIRLLCSEQENLRRAVNEERKIGGTTKLMDIDIIKRMRNEEDIYSFGGDYELSLDVTSLSAEEAAREILEFVKTVSLKTAAWGT